MPQSSTNFVNPASLSTVNTAVSSSSSSAPTAPPRKRARSDVTPEERREARAHRNRIAAQNSRDRRKVQFCGLQARVTELEQENSNLRAELSKYISNPSQVVQQILVPDTRERENEELRERVRHLEKSWESVVRLLGAQVAGPDVSGLNPASSPSSSVSSPLFPSASPSPSDTTLQSGSPVSKSEESTRHSARVATTSTSHPRPLDGEQVALPRVDSSLRPIKIPVLRPQHSIALRVQSQSKIGSWNSSLPLRRRPNSRQLTTRIRLRPKPPLLKHILFRMLRRRM